MLIQYWLGNDGKLYGIPAGSSRVMCIDPNSDTYTLMGEVLGDVGGAWKWDGGVRAKDGRIFGIPGAADKVLCINPANGTVTQVGPSLGVGEEIFKWQGGVLAHDGNIYCMPGSAKQVLCINPSKEEVTVTKVGDDLGSGGERWNRGCCAANGMVFGFPRGQTRYPGSIHASKHEHNHHAILTPLSNCTAVSIAGTAFRSCRRHIHFDRRRNGYRCAE
jgi:hypothetical protein